MSSSPFPSSSATSSVDGGDTLHRRWRTEGPPPQRQARLLSLDLAATQETAA